MTEKNIFPKEPMKPIEKPVHPGGNNISNEPLHKNSLWFTHDPAIYHDPVSGKYYVYGTGADGLCSDDMVTWERIGKITDVPPKDAFDHVGTNHIWAPDIVKVGEEYRLYCSNSSFGVQQKKGLENV